MTSRVWVGVGLGAGIAAAAAAAAVALKGQCSRAGGNASAQTGERWKPRGARLADDIEAIRRNTDRMLEIATIDHVTRETVPAG